MTKMHYLISFFCPYTCSLQTKLHQCFLKSSPNLGEHIQFQILNLQHDAMDLYLKPAVTNGLE